MAAANKMFASGGNEEVDSVIIGVHEGDRPRLTKIAGLIGKIKATGTQVILLAKDITPAEIHALMRSGADDFLPYPTPKGDIHECLARLHSKRMQGDDAPPGEGRKERRRRKGVVLPVYAVAGGVGGTTFAVNLAWELALATKKSQRRVCLLDFNFQYGAVSTYLDLPRLEAIYELISDTSTLDNDSLASALTSFRKRLAVLTAPMDALPYDIVGPEDVSRLIETAQASYEFVIIDMPQTLTHWSETVLTICETYFVVMEIDMRSAQNMLRFLRTLKAEDLPLEKLEVVLNRAPRFTDLSGRNRVRRMAESLGVKYNIMLPDGGRQVVNACDQGAPLAEAAKSNALRKEIRRVANSILETIEAQQAAIA